MEIFGLFNDFSKSFKSCNLVERCCIKNEIQWQGDHNSHGRQIRVHPVVLWRCKTESIQITHSSSSWKSSTRVKTPLICKCSSQYDDRYIEVSLLLYKYQDTLYPLTSWGVWFATFTWLIAKWVNDFIGHTHTHCRIFCHQNMLPAALSLREIHLFHCNTGVRCSRVNYLLMNLIARQLCNDRIFQY